MQDSVAVADKGIGRSEWVLSRPLYRYARFELKAVPKPQRAQALELQIKQWTPFARTGWYLLWQQDDALVWAWDADRVAAAILENKLKPGTVTIVPETLLHPGQEQGILLLTCMEGYEGQVWSGRALTGSRWWPELPAAAEWLNFQRDAGTLPEKQSTTVPEPLPLHWTEKPWAKSAALDRSAAYGANIEQKALPTAVLCLLAATLWYGAQWIKMQTAIESRGAELETLKQRAGPIIAARGQALETLDRIRTLEAIDSYPDQLGLMARVAESLPKDGPYLREWAFQNGKLTLRIASPNKMVSSEYVKLFQSLEVFRNVQTAPDNEPAGLALVMDVLAKGEGAR